MMMINKHYVDKIVLLKSGKIQAPEQHFYSAYTSIISH